MRKFSFFVVFLLVLASTQIAAQSKKPIDYDKAGRDFMVMMSDDGSLTVAEYKSRLRETGMSSKDFFILLKMSSSRNKINELVTLLSLDVSKKRMRELGIDAENLIRALQEWLN